MGEGIGVSGFACEVEGVDVSRSRDGMGIRVGELIHLPCLYTRQTAAPVSRAGAFS